MRILQISSATKISGSERHLIDLTQSLIGRGHEVFLAAAPASPLFEGIPELKKENILEVKIKNSLDVFAAFKLAGFIEKNKIEIVHAHLAKDYLPAGIAVRRSSGAKFVLSRHVLFSMNFLHKFALANAAKAIAGSVPVETYLQKIFPPEKIALIPYGIKIESRSDTDRETLGRGFRFEHDIPFDAPLVGMLGELKVLKGQRDFVLAAKILAEKYSDIHFVISGRDNSVKKDFRRELKRLVKIFDLEKQFLFLDWLEDTTPLLAALDVFVSASHTESFGPAILEAMANGTPVAATATDSAMQLIGDGETGILTQIKDPTALAARIGELLYDENLRKTLSENARKAALEKYSVEKMALEIEKVYQQVLNNPR